MAKPKSAARWEPARHEKDDWLDQMSAKNRFVFDTITANGLGDALAFATNFILVNKSDYGVVSKDLAVIVVVRHRLSRTFANLKRAAMLHGRLRVRLECRGLTQQRL